jgi:hypothetical protein
LKHFTTADFWLGYKKLPPNIQALADQNFNLLKIDPYHPSLHFKKTGKYRSVRVGRHYRALALEIPEGLLWFWIGSHSEYDQLLR